MFLPCNDYSQRAFHDLIPRFEYGKDDQQRRLGSNGNRGPARALDERSRPVCAVEPARSHQPPACAAADRRSEEHTSELQSLMRISYAVFCLKKKKKLTKEIQTIIYT